jgi:tetratricopeptide (TPR) repeat protein
LARLARVVDGEKGRCSTNLDQRIRIPYMPRRLLSVDQLNQALIDALIERRISLGFSLLDQHKALLHGFTPEQSNAAALVLSIAQWVDLGYGDAKLVEEALAKFPHAVRRRMPFLEFLLLRMAEAFCAIVLEESDSAIRLLDFVLNASDELGDKRLIAIAHFWKGRSHRKKGEYDAARTDIVAGRELMEEIGAPKLAAVIRIQESWLLFQKGQSEQALRLLDQAERQLTKTDDWLSLGNIESARGRIVRQVGKFAEALEYFDRAVKTYGHRDPNHRNLARALVNAAYVRRLVALHLRKRIDARARQSGRKSAANRVDGYQQRFNELCQLALQDLQRAGEIYALHQHYGGAGSVLVNTGYLHLDGGEIDVAAGEAFRAYQLAHDKNDHILMARARILQAATENAHVDEQLGEDADVAVHATVARQYSDEAISLAQQTQNRSLIAEAHLSRGATASNDFFQDWEEAKRCVGAASELLSPEDRDHVWEEMLLLKSRVLRASGIDDTLRAWSEGMVGDKTFQQIAEEFAEIVIPKVWAREGKKISRVAERLSVSPKKVRRILRNAGFLDHG